MQVNTLKSGVESGVFTLLGPDHQKIRKDSMIYMAETSFELQSHILEGCWTGTTVPETTSNGLTTLMLLLV